MSTTTDIALVVRAEMRDFIAANFLYMRPDLELRDDDDLLSLGVIDSIGFVELVGEVEERYGVAIADVEIVEENFGSVAAIAAFVAAKTEQVV